MKLELIKEFAPSEKKTADDSKSGMDQWVTTEEAARIIGVSTGRIRQFVQEGRLTPREKTDSDHYFKRADVEAFAKKKRERTGRPKGAKTEDKSDE